MSDPNSLRLNEETIGRVRRAIRSDIAGFFGDARSKMGQQLDEICDRAARAAVAELARIC